ncbi:helix-turn-helix domain-containing protein [Streptacidiphilus sp. EB129]|uniref:helix-turn-helix domain-containing protein n=1 Tax=Streptacidiphilus sp. EB129 TaxID=3156262 RepID=UPI0035191FFB
MDAAQNDAEPAVEHPAEGNLAEGNAVEGNAATSGPTADDPRIPGVRVVADVETIKALSDPLRVTILRVVMDRGARGLRAWTAKELAAELGEPQTKLYRHLKTLEERGLLRVAETRLVSGIVEQRYAAGQTSLELSRDFLEREVAPDDQAAVFSAGIDSYRRHYLAAVAAGRVEFPADVDAAECYRRPLMMLGDVRMAPERASQFQAKLSELINEYLAEGECDEGVSLNVLISCYVDQDPAAQDPAAQGPAAAPGPEGGEGGPGRLRTAS